jgi:imidazolonepropionase
MLILHNALQVVTVATRAGGGKRGGEMRDIGVRTNASVRIDGNRIVDVVDAASVTIGASDTVIDCTGNVILPGFVDSHTHALFTGARAHDFALRIEGKSYQEIAEAGGGIVYSMQGVRKASRSSLHEMSIPRLREMLHTGTTTVEIKSGYGLDLPSEMKMLEVIDALKGETPLEIHATFLGAHAVPTEYRGRQSAYVEYVISEMIPAVAASDLAEFCDVFCDKGYFTNNETERIARAGMNYGLAPKLHVDELADTSGAALAARIGALSADHLLCVSDAGIAALKQSGTVATLLPGTAYFLGMPYAPARKLIDGGCTVALATDFNPGSSPTSNMQTVLSLACTQMKMTIEEAITAATINGAAALGMAERIGSIENGKQADMIVCDVSDYREVAYWMGENVVGTVVKRGVVVGALKS